MLANIRNHDTSQVKSKRKYLFIKFKISNRVVEIFNIWLAKRKENFLYKQVQETHYYLFPSCLTLYLTAKQDLNHIWPMGTVSQSCCTLSTTNIYSQKGTCSQGGRLTYNSVLLGVLHEGSFKFISPPSFRCWLQCHLPGLFTGLTFSNANLPSIGQVQISLILYYQ